MKRSVFIISDRTGITAETLGLSLLTQFENIEFNKIILPFVDTTAKAQQAVVEINQAANDEGNRPLVFCTVVRSDVQAILKSSNCLLLNFFETFINPLEKELGIESAHAVGRARNIDSSSNYKQRIDAVNYALTSDDGTSVKNLPAAEIILIGVSRTGKTPSCLYLALQYGVFAANVPLTDDDLGGEDVPSFLRPYRDRLFGLTIDPARLSVIRQERRADSRYSEITQCQSEVRAAESIYRQQKIPFLNTSTVSIEEIATTILTRCKIDRHLLG